MNKLTIIIPLYNSEKYIVRCLETILQQTRRDFNVLLFDNQGKRHKEIVSIYMSQLAIEYISSETNLGWTGANNFALKSIRTPYAFLLNADTHMNSKCIEKLLAFAESHGDTVLVSPEILDYEDVGYNKEGFPLNFNIETGLISAYKLIDDYTEVNFVPGTAMLINISKIPKYELHFREDFFMYHEDIEFSIRMIALGYGKHYFVKGPKVAHASTQSMERLSTCKNALKNCLVCLCLFQSKTMFIARTPRYIFVFLKQYFSYYRLFYPFAYPYYFFLYLGRSIFLKNKLSSGDIVHSQNIYKIMNSKMKVLFSFIF